jgi:O-antigen/teichoic acid export membrane protein
MILTRILGPDGRGQLAVAMAFGAIGVRFANFGLHASNTYSVSKERTLLPVLLGNSLLVSFVLVGVLALLLAVAFAMWPEIAPLKGSLLFLGVSWIPVGLAYMLLQNLLLGMQEVSLYNKIELCGRLAGIALAFLLILLNAVSAVTIFSASLLVVCCSLLWAFWRLYLRCKEIPYPSISLLRENVHCSFQFYLASFFSSIIIRIDLLMVQYILGAEQTGLYSIASSVAELSYMLPAVVGSLLFPKLAALTDDQEKWQIAQKVALNLGLFMLPLLLLLALLARPLMGLLFGEAFLGAAPPLVWLTPGILFLSIGTIFQNYLGSTGNPGLMIYGPLLAAVFNVVANFYWIHRYGILGAAYASTLAYAITAVVSWRICTRNLQ